MPLQNVMPLLFLSRSQIVPGLLHFLTEYQFSVLCLLFLLKTLYYYILPYYSNHVNFLENYLVFSHLPSLGYVKIFWVFLMTDPEHHCTPEGSFLLLISGAIQKVPQKTVCTSTLEIYISVLYFL